MPPSQPKIDYESALREVAKSMVRLKRPERLLKMVTRFLGRTLGLTHASMMVLEEKKKRFVFVDSKGHRRMPVNLIKMDLDHPLVRWFEKSKKKKKRDDYLSASCLREKLLPLAGESSGETNGKDLGRVAKALRDLKAELAIPAYYKETLLGLLLLGEKINQEPFSASDVSFFQVLAQDCSMAFKSAEFHQHLIQKNQELERQLHEIGKLRKKERSIYHQIMSALAQEVHAKDAYTFGHVNQVERLGVITAKEMGLRLSEYKEDVLKAGLILHDVGKIGIPDHILKKQSRLTEEEWKIMRTHVDKGAKILEPLEDFKDVAEIVRSHHENYDGSGYPRGIRGEEIPIEARIVSVVDAFHAMVSTRCYSKGRPIEIAFEELKRCAGTQFDPAVVDAFIRAIKREMKKRGVGFFLDESTQGPPPAAS